MMVYPVMFDPPFLAGAFQLSTTLVLRGTAETFVGAPGTVAVRTTGGGLDEDVGAGVPVAMEVEETVTTRMARVVHNSVSPCLWGAEGLATDIVLEPDSL
jgi:hypothetical protein